MRGALLWTRRGYLVEAHVVEGRSVSELAAAHGVHRSWIYKLLARYKAGGYGAALPAGTPAEVVEEIVALRRGLESEGHDCGAATIAYHLTEQMDPVPSVSTIWRVLKREGLVTPQPQKRPRSSLIRFEAELPNEMWRQRSRLHGRSTRRQGHAADRARAARDRRQELTALPPLRPAGRWSACTRR